MQHLLIVVIIHPPTHYEVLRPPIPEDMHIVVYRELILHWVSIDTA